MAETSSETERQFSSIKNAKSVDTPKLIQTIADALLDKQAEDVTVLNVQKLTTLTDAFVVCHANTDVQIKAIASSVLQSTREKLGEKPWQKEGLDSRRWVILDYVNVVVHIFRKDLREHYALERIWNDAEISTITDDES